ncbi:MAG: Bro-N domain-containing protein [Pseudoxanthomonas suwonensis]|nr:Bro-N domain-containing protein [Pseudoxanthomonas suwonensis]
MQHQSVTPFAFGDRSVRTVMLDGAPWFVAKDVAELLGYPNAAAAISRHCKGVAKHDPLPTAGGIQQVRVIAEPDVWRLIIGSKRPEALAIERWLFEEVLPTLRRTGSYAIAAPAANDPLIELQSRVDELEYHLERVERVVFPLPAAARAVPVPALPADDLGESVLAFICRHPGQVVTQRDLTHGIRAARKPHALVMTLAGLLESGQIVPARSPVGQLGRPRHGYQLAA